MFRLQRERNQKFGAGQSIDILLGRRTEKVAQYGHDSITTFGIGGELREAEWVVRQLLAQGLLAVEGEYGTLVLTEASKQVLGRYARWCYAASRSVRCQPPDPEAARRLGARC